jgi:DNA sulfur modification protein DndD
MHLKVRIKAISWKNIRQIEDLRYEVENLDGVNLLQIQNGYGKTTTLRLLRYIFMGTLPVDEEILSFRYIGDQIEGNRSEGEFWVDFLIDDVDYSIGIEFDFDSRIATFITVSPDRGGKIYGWEPPRKFKQKFYKKDDFVKLFVFDGEMAKELNETQGAKLIEYAIRQVTDLDKIVNLIGYDLGTDGTLDEILSNELDRIKASLDGRMKNLSSALEEVKKHIKAMKKREEEARKELDTITKNKENFEKELDNIDSGVETINNQLDDAKDKKKQAESDLRARTKEILEALFNPGVVIERVPEIKEFYSKIEKEKIPRLIGKTFLIDLMDGEKCLCGTHWNTEMKDYTKSNMENYLGDEIISTIKGIQTKVRESICPIHSIQGAIEELKNLKQAVKDNEDLIDTIRSSFDENKVTRIKQLSEQISKFEDRILKLEKEIEELTITDRGLINSNQYDINAYKATGEPYITPNKFKKCKNIYTLEKLKDYLQTELSSIEGLVNFDSAINLTKNVITEALNEILEELRNNVIDETNKHFLQMHAGGGDHQIRSLSNGLRFVNRYGDEMETVNMAAQLAAAYSYVTSMYNLGQIEVPLIIDSPTTGFGLGVARNWAKEIPDNYPQVIGFITSAEKVGLMEYVNNNNVSVSTIRRSKEGIKGSPQTGKMIIDKDRGFFENYEVDVDMVSV